MAKKTNDPAVVNGEEIDLGQVLLDANNPQEDNIAVSDLTNEPIEDIKSEQPKPDESTPDPKSDPDSPEEPQASETEPDDDLMDLSTKGLLKRLNQSGAKLEITDKTSDLDIREAIRSHQSTQAPVQQADDLRKWLNDQAQIMGFSGGQQSQPQQPPIGGQYQMPFMAAQQNQQPVAQQPSQQFQQMAHPQAFVTDDSYAQALESKDQFNKVLNDVMAQAQQQTMQMLLPSVNQLLQQHLTLHTAAADFYAENPDLRSYRPFVEFVANSVQSQNPNMSIHEILAKTGEMAREKLRLAKPSDQSAGDILEQQLLKLKGKQSPAFATGSGGGGRPSGKKITDKEKEILDLIS